MSRRPPTSVPIAESSAAASEPERIVASLRPHGRALLWPSLLLIGIAFSVAYFAGAFAEPWQNWAVAVAGGVLSILIVLVPVLRWLSRRYVITTRRIVVRSGLFVRSRQELLHSQGVDITVRQGALQRMTGCGDVLVNTGLDRVVVLADVPHAALVQSTLHDLGERSRGVDLQRR